MIRKSLHLLAVLVVTGALTVIAPPSAAAFSGCPNPFWGIFCPEPYLMTPLGALSQGTQISAAGADARMGLYSPETDKFMPSTDWMSMVKNRWIREDKIKATDGVVAPVKGYASVSTPFGEASWAIQYFFDYGRTGIYNLTTNTFYPQGDWYPVASCSVVGKTSSTLLC